MNRAGHRRWLSLMAIAVVVVPASGATPRQIAASPGLPRLIRSGVLSPPLTAQSARAGPCDDVRDYRTLTARGHVRVYTWRHPKPSQVHDVFACDTKTRVRQTLTAPGFTDSVGFPPPAIAISGAAVAFAQDGLPNDVGTDDIYARTSIQVNTLAPPPGGGGLLVVETAAPAKAFPEVKVVTVVTTPTGHLAWVACRSATYNHADDRRRYRGFLTGARARCQRPGQLAWVLAARPGPTWDVAAGRVLDAGTQIDPLSLRLHGARLIWETQGRPGRRRSSC